MYCSLYHCCPNTLPLTFNTITNKQQIITVRPCLPSAEKRSNCQVQFTAIKPGTVHNSFSGLIQPKHEALFQLRFVSLSHTLWIFISSTSARARISVFRYRRNIMRRDSSVNTGTRLRVWRPGGIHIDSLSFPKTSRSAVGHNLPAVQCVTGGYTPGN